MSDISKYNVDDEIVFLKDIVDILENVRSRGLPPAIAVGVDEHERACGLFEEGLVKLMEANNDQHKNEEDA